VSIDPAITVRPSHPLARAALFVAALFVLSACASVTTDTNPEALVRTSADGGFSDLSAALEPGLAEFRFAYVGEPGPVTFEIDMSTVPGMDADVYGNFGSGSSSPIVVVGGATGWDKYECGRTLYWRVRVHGTSIVSPIQTAVVCPPNAFTDLSGAFNRNQAAFVFEYAGDDPGFTIHASTRPDMSGELWTTTASRSPVRLRQPASVWKGYDCGYILYWRVEDAAGLLSPVQEKHVCGSVGFSDESATFTADEAVFSFRYRGAADDFRVDVSTRDDMSWDVYVGFGAGSGSPIVVLDPQARWDKYDCDQTLYWRVSELSNGAVGEIRTTTVTCAAAP
jgi:hypothetical protein